MRAEAEGISMQEAAVGPGACANSSRARKHLDRIAAARRA
jgi:hypothetical protein